jgi:signal transduction histidine kinase
MSRLVGTGSLRFRIILGTIVATSVIVLVAAAIAWSSMQFALLHEADRRIGALLAHHAAGPPEPRPRPPGQAERGPRDAREFGAPPDDFGRPDDRRGPGDFAGPAPHDEPPDHGGPDAGQPPRDADRPDRPSDVEHGEAMPQSGPPGPRRGWGPGPESEDLVEVRGEDDRLLFRSGTLRSDESLLAAGHPGWRGEPRTVALASGRLVRVARATVQRRGRDGDGGQQVRIYAACDISRAQGETDRLAAVLVLLWLGATLLAVAASLALQRAILRPVARISEALVQLGPERLAARVPENLAPRELQPIIGQLNELLTRVEAAFIREKMTIANIAHELRTPVASLRCTLEFALAAERTPVERNVAERCLGVTLDLQRMITNLLALARIEAGLEQIVRQPVELIDLVERSWQPLAEEAIRRGVTLSGQGSCCGCFIATAPDQARLALGNLLANAVAYARTGTAISLTVTASDGQTHLAIDNVSDLPPPPLEHLGQAFVRGDTARTGGDHAGLGLALVRRLMPLLGGSLALAVPQTGQFRATVSFPTAEPPT